MRSAFFIFPTKNKFFICVALFNMLEIMRKFIKIST